MPNQSQSKGSKAERKFEKPVAWLLGRQLMASLKSTLLYTAFGNKIDARDWMDAKVYSFNKEASERAKKIIDPDNPQDRPVELIIVEPGQEDFWKQKNEFWFDYISDTGDGMKATYSIAYLCLSNLWVEPGLEEMPTRKQADVKREDQVKVGETTLEKLPRGEFLLVGGDTSYHLSDYASLHTRFQVPFSWAHEDLAKDLGRKSDKDKTAEEKRKDLKTLRPIFGIPGNHDYYDMLDGFRRQFRAPTKTRSEAKLHYKESETSQLRIPGFRRYQETSYLALRLPFEWMLWGLDTEVGKIDERQRDFFKSVYPGGPHKKLIVCTSAPTTVFGKFADKEDEKSAKAFLQLDLARPFLNEEKQEESQSVDPGQPEKKLEPGQIRLDLSGDVHQYARYWGPPSPNTQPTRRRSKKIALHAENYASVVSGLGGAFHHPTTTYVDDIKEQALYPKDDDSRKEVAGQIFNPWRVVKGGGVWLIGSIIALIIAFAAIANDSSRPAINNFPPFIWANITNEDQYDSTVLLDKKLQQRIEPSVWKRLGFDTASWTPKFPDDPKCDTSKPMYLWGKCHVEWPGEYTLGFVTLLFTMVPILGAIFISRHYYQLSKKQKEVTEEARTPEKPEEQPRRDTNQRIVRMVTLTLWLATGIAILLAAIGLLSIVPYREFITPFGNSLLVLLTLVWAAAATFLSINYSDWLFEQAAKRKIGKSDWWITWVLSASAVASLAIGLWVFGKNNLPAYLVSDILFVIIIFVVPLLLALIAAKMGGANQKGFGKVGLVLIGIWHAIVQLGVAWFLIKKGTWLTVLLAVLLVPIFWWIGKRLMERNLRWWLTIAWVVFGMLMLALPPLVFLGLRSLGGEPAQGLMDVIFYPHKFSAATSFASYEWWGNYGGWLQLVPILLAGVFGAFLSCTWLGWYFGVCLGFNGHNNESGGAARIERFKQLIRFRLRKDDLTGFVIAVDDPKEHGNQLEPRLIDVFHLKAVADTKAR